MAWHVLAELSGPASVGSPMYVPIGAVNVLSSCSLAP